MKKERLIVILGPTAVGKTALSIELAKKLQTEIISGDSMLVYKGFDIGSAKPTMKERQGVVHHMIDIMEPQEKYSVTQFRKSAVKYITEINTKGKIPILAGGTGLYIKALVEGYYFNKTPGDAVYRKKLEQLAEEKGKIYVYNMLVSVDEKTAARLHVNDFRRVIRALEVYHMGGEQISREKSATDGELKYDVYVVGLTRERAALYKRIDFRVELMFASGLEAEVARLQQNGITCDCQAMQGIGYKETAAYLAGEISREQVVALIQRATRHFAKRQLTWYKKMPYIHWYDVGDYTADNLIDVVYADIAGTFEIK
ncbi:MAG: tRNA (adenosine(37)-N6)-dimethylallyltransferase MiaA [Selenomonadaceae bacterium]